MSPAHPLVNLAVKHWQSKAQKGKLGKTNQIRWSPAIVQEVYDQANLADQILPATSLSILSRTDYVEKYLWPHYEKDASEATTQAIVAILLYRQETTDFFSWDVLLHPTEVAKLEVQDRITFFYHHLFSRSLRQEASALTGTIRAVKFLSLSFRYLHEASIRTACLPYVLLPIWSQLSSNHRDAELIRVPQLRKLWRLTEKRFNQAAYKYSHVVSPYLGYRRRETYTFIGGTGVVVSSPAPAQVMDTDEVLDDKAAPSREKSSYRLSLSLLSAILVEYILSVLGLIITLTSQLPTRRFTWALLQDHHFLPHLRVLYSSLQSPHPSLTTAYNRLTYLMTLPVDEHTGSPITEKTMLRRLSRDLGQLQQFVFAHYGERMHGLSLVSFSSLLKGQGSGLVKQLELLDDPSTTSPSQEIRSLLERLGLGFSRYPPNSPEAMVGKEVPGLVLLETFRDAYTSRANIILSSFISTASQHGSSVFSLPSIFPTENDLFLATTTDVSSVDQSLLRDRPLQYLTLPDLLHQWYFHLRSLVVQEVKPIMLDSVARLQPSSAVQQSSPSPGSKANVATSVLFSGWSRYAAPLTSAPSLRECLYQQGPTGRELRSLQLDVRIDLGRYTASVRGEWERHLRIGDTLFLLHVAWDEEEGGSTPNWRIRGVRGARLDEFIALDGSKLGRRTREVMEQEGITIRGYRLALDPYQGELDVKAREEGREMDDRMYQSYNILLRLPEAGKGGRRATLEALGAALGECMLVHGEEDGGDEDQSDDEDDESDEEMKEERERLCVVPGWLEAVLLGYGDPAGAHYTQLTQQGKEESKDRKRKLPLYEAVRGDDQLKAAFPDLTLMTSEGQKGAQGSEKAKKKEKATKASKEEEPGPKANGMQWVEISEIDGTIRWLRENQEEEADEFLASYSTSQLDLSYTPPQIQAIQSGTSRGLSLISGGPGTGKATVIAQTIANLYRCEPKKRILVLAGSEGELSRLFMSIHQTGIVEDRHIARVGPGGFDQIGLSLRQAVDIALQRRLWILAQVDQLAMAMNLEGEYGSTCETAGYFYLTHVMPRWGDFEREVGRIKEEGGGTEAVRRAFPFTPFWGEEALWEGEGKAENQTVEEAFRKAYRAYKYVQVRIFEALEELRPLELIKDVAGRAKYLLGHGARVIGMTCQEACVRRTMLREMNFRYDTVILTGAERVSEGDSLVSLFLLPSLRDRRGLDRVILAGDGEAVWERNGQSLLSRFLSLGVPRVRLGDQARSRPEISLLYRWAYSGPPEGLRDMEEVVSPSSSSPAYAHGNAGFTYSRQWIQVEGEGALEPSPGFLQNVDEAEYVIATYQYMRLLGYPSESILLLATTPGQRALLRDVWGKRCGWNREALWGPVIRISTVDEAIREGAVADYVLLSLVWTQGEHPVEKMVAKAASRARLGAYLFGQHRQFGEEALSKDWVQELLDPQVPRKLAIQVGEMWKADGVDRSGGSGTVSEMENLEHLGKYVHRMMEDWSRHHQKQQEQQGQQQKEAE
ncbi:P-loop containing nucleoside triphosphate hydrolase protein [Piptocephalis cylindrospora]|uniref:P-loop containing nucleoside triphosphate hydrolase protein n=1 Tax=Piptocephalis cylindrospora TaxID=1907219 RepID=A0A4P9Y898_9FUNG|nr:P-loop containing nucleoside triphosphate hydrolase protein [Piptocephalis cylindrospora]|eukprot:RKP14200.1 P-loop containing nucleoside triphosphate hydrolase protein [Piptocephalis cylindrospora]